MCSTIFVFQHSSTALFPEQCEGGWLLHPTFAALSLSETLRFGLFEAEARSLVVACQWAPMGAARTSWRWWHLQAPCTKQARWVVTLWQWRLALRPWRGWRTNPAVEYIYIYNMWHVMLMFFVQQIVGVCNSLHHVSARSFFVIPDG